MMILTKSSTGAAVEFSFSTVYQNKSMKFTVKSAAEYSSVFIEGKLIGQITIGPGRHTWHVVDSNYLDYQLVKEIGQKVIEHAI